MALGPGDPHGWGEPASPNFPLSGTPGGGGPQALVVGQSTGVARAPRTSPRPPPPLWSRRPRSSARRCARGSGRRRLSRASWGQPRSSAGRWGGGLGGRTGAWGHAKKKDLCGQCKYLCCCVSIFVVSHPNVCLCVMLCCVALCCAL